eukprot:7477892-Ditylum_brightwellii.AAC.1
MYDPTGRVKTKQCLVKFVEDATLLHNLANVFNLKPKDLMEIVKNNTALWGRYLWVSGGWLEYSKTKCRLLIWKFEQNEKPKIKKENNLPDNNIKIEGADGSQTKLKRFPPEEGIRMLGSRHALTMQQETEL